MPGAASRAGARTLLLIAAPVAAITVGVIVWVSAAAASGFWADDFLNVTHYAGSLDLSNTRFNAGRLVTNVFWAVGNATFGDGSVLPFLAVDAVVLAAGAALWLWAGRRTRWGAVDACWVGGLFVATSAWLPTALWSTNITHAGGFLALGVGLLAHERAIAAPGVRGAALWSLASGAAWTAAVVCNLAYLGLLVIAAYCSVHQARKLRGLGLSALSAGAAVASWSLLAPIVYFAVVAYPATTQNSVYTATGLGNVWQNLRFYRSVLAPGTTLSIVYLVVLLGSIAGGLVAARRRDLFPLTVLGAAAAIAATVLVQGRQRDVHYLAMPLLLVFSAAAAAVRPAARLRGPVFVAAAATLVLVFRQGADIRSFFVRSPYGSALLPFRAAVASLTPRGRAICAKLRLDPLHQELFIAEMAGTAAFLVPPISAPTAALAMGAEPCPAGTATITVGLDPRGDFVATTG